MLKISCWGYYGKDNTGDDLLLAELLKRIKQYAEDALITIFSDQEIPYIRTLYESTHICPRSSKDLFHQSLVTDVMICGGGGTICPAKYKENFALASACLDYAIA